MPCELLNLVIAFAPLFSKPVFEHAKVLLVGAILSPASRTVTQALRVMGKADDPHFQNYHRVLNRAEWSALQGGRILFEMLVRFFVPTGEIVIGYDETIERRWGRRIKARGIYRDAVRSSRSHFVKTSGLRWLSFMLLSEVRFAKRVWALPFLTVLCPSERYDRERGIRHRKLTDRARQAIEMIARWLPERELIFVGDSSFAALDLLNAVRRKVTMITRLRLDAALYEPAPPKKPGQKGRPRKKGQRLPTLQQIAEDAQTCWQKLTVSNWYGEGEREIEIVSGTCVWYHVGKEVVPIRWVLIRDPQEEFETQALLSTKTDAMPDQIISWFLKRWQVEVTFEEARRHLGVETNRQWSDKAINRTTPCLFGMYSLITMLAEELDGQKKLPVRQAAWYEKEAATFSDAIGQVRQYLWEWRSFQTSVKGAEMVKIPRPIIESLTQTLCYAA